MNSCSENLIVKLSVLVLFPVAVFFKHPGKNNFRESTHFCSQFKVHSIMSIVAGSVECVGEWQCLKQTGHMEFRVREQRRGANSCLAHLILCSSALSLRPWAQETHLQGALFVTWFFIYLKTVLCIDTRLC